MKSIKSIVPIEIQQIVNKLSEKYEVYFVGGCVRDFLLRKDIHDFDCTTSATVDEMKEQLNEFKIIETGIKHGTLTIMNHNHCVEITTYRIDSKYIHHRFPTSVEFTRNIEEDLKRRDFTINAIACDLDGNILDYHHGIYDLENKIIRCVGNPITRFSEDALRILRAIRFSSTLNFEIEKNTKKAIFDCMPLLEYISIERKRDELFKILVTSNPYSILKEYNLYNIYNIPSIEINNNIPNDLVIRTASLFIDQENARKTLHQWHCANKFINDVCILIKYKNEEVNNKYMIRKLIYLYGKELTQKILLFKKVDTKLYNEIIMNKDYLINIDINGNDLIELGYQGKEIKDKLNELLELVLHDLSINNKDILIKILKK